MAYAPRPAISTRLYRLTDRQGQPHPVLDECFESLELALEAAMESLAQEVRPFGIGVTLVQPGPFRTGFLERSTERAAARIDDYAATSGKFLTYLGSIAGKQPGDPGGAARAILTVADAERPPLRLVRRPDRALRHSGQRPHRHLPDEARRADGLGADPRLRRLRG